MSLSSTRSDDLISTSAVGSPGRSMIRSISTARSGLQVRDSPVGVPVLRQVHDLGDHEVLERLAVLVGPGVQGDGKRPIQRAFDPCVEEIELGIDALLLPDGAMERGQEEAHQGVFQEAEVG